MSQNHKTCFYLQRLLKLYMESQKTYKCNVYEGGAFEALELPFICVMAMSQSGYVSGYGVTGNKLTSIAIVLQTGISTSENEHWEMWAEIEDMFCMKTTDLMTCLNGGYEKSILVQNATFGELLNACENNVRMTQLQIEFLTSIIGE